MGRPENLELRKKIWDLYCNNPEPAHIARELGIDRQLVHHHLKKIKGDLNYRLNVKTIEEFAEWRLALMDSLRKEIADITEKIDFLEKQGAYDLALKYRDYRKGLKLDLYEVMGDGEAVLSLRRKMLLKKKEQEETANQVVTA